VKSHTVSATHGDPHVYDLSTAYVGIVKSRTVSDMAIRHAKHAMTDGQTDGWMENPLWYRTSRTIIRLDYKLFKVG